MHFLYLVPNSFSSEIKIIGLGFDSIFWTEILCCHTILIVYEEKVFFGSIPPTDYFNHALCHLRPNDDWQKGKKNISLGQSKLRRPICAKCKKNGELEIGQAEFPLEQFITNVLQYLATLVEVSYFLRPEYPSSFLVTIAKYFILQKQSSCEKELMNCSAYG